MTRDFTLTLTAGNTWYSLWDLIKESFGELWDATFSNLPYIPSLVSSLKVQNLTPGVHVFRTETPDDPYVQKGFDFVGYAWDLDEAPSNWIDLKSKYYSTDAAGSKINVSIIAN